MNRLAGNSSGMHYHKKPQQQRGSALLIGLLILLTMTLIGLSSLNTSLLEEKMASNTQKKTIAFQDAEATINDAIRIVTKDPDLEVLVSVDGQEEALLNPPMEVRIKKATHSVNLVKRPTGSYYDVLRAKLLWGKDARGS